jgi:4-diphosphocytidyl-2-C-methyl-D-erythritol kinase
MGGGSSDAATCLLALNRLWGLGLTRSELSDIGLKLGADVPFFLGGYNAWVEGVGELLTPVSLPSARFVVVKPPTGASTPAIFSSPELQRDTKTAILQGFAANTNAERSNGDARIACDLQKILDFGHNDLQPVAQTLCPDVVRCLEWLSARGLHGRMTGSGTAVFAQLPQGTDLSGAPADWMVRECSNMDAHPLLDWCPG